MLNVNNGLLRLGLPVVAFAAAGAAFAQAVPPDYKASPDVYRVVADNGQYVVVEGTWKPGQRDTFHSHPAMLFYWVTDCQMRWYLPDNTTRDITVRAGLSEPQQPIPSHSVQNVGTSDCKIIMFEPK